MDWDKAINWNGGDGWQLVNSWDDIINWEVVDSLTDAQVSAILDIFDK